MLEYFELPDKTAETIDADGWLHTGDLVSMDARGYPTITGRLKDMIIRGGENIYPREIEEVLLLTPRSPRSRYVACPTKSGANRSVFSSAIQIPLTQQPTPNYTPTCANTCHRRRRLARGIESASSR